MTKDVYKGIGFVLFVSIILSLAYQSAMKPRNPRTREVKAARRSYNIEDLLDAIEIVESGCNPSAVGDNGKAVGAYQIWKIYVDDVNRFSDIKYTYSDRWDRDKSRAMTRAYILHYGGSLEEMARKHNGGPSGHKKQSTITYWNKIKENLK